MRQIRKYGWGALLAAFTFLVGCESGDRSFDQADTGGDGQGGSMARFAVKGDYLYTVDHTKLNLFNISDAAQPQKQGEFPFGFGVETIFPYADKLFIGTQTGMHILSLQNPAAPQRLATYEHIVACDPVVTDGRYAYVTLSTGATCRTVNELHILDLQNIRNPTLVRRYPMENPKGLGIDGASLFVCDKGLKVYDAANANNIQLRQKFSIQAYDVIPDNGRLLVIGDDGFYQYRYNQQQQLELLSKIAVEPAG